MALGVARKDSQLIHLVTTRSSSLGRTGIERCCHQELRVLLRSFGEEIGTPDCCGFKERGLNVIDYNERHIAMRNSDLVIYLLRDFRVRRRIERTRAGATGDAGGGEFGDGGC